jgi:hypothetical protein
MIRLFLRPDFFYDGARKEGTESCRISVDFFGMGYLQL